MKIWKFVPVLFLSMLFILANSVYATNVKVTALVEESSPIATDLLTMVDDPGGTPISKKVTIANIIASTGNIGASTIVTTGALDSGSITSNFGTIDNGASNITTTGDITGGTHAATSDTASDDNASMGYDAGEGLVLTGQGTVTDVTIKNDADGTVISIPTGTTNVDIVGVATAATFEPDGDTTTGDAAAIGYDAADGIVITGQGSTNDITIRNDADTAVIEILTGTTNVDIVGDATAATFKPDGATASSDTAAFGYTAALGAVITGQGSTNDVTIKNDADAVVAAIITGTINFDIVGIGTAATFAPDGDTTSGLLAAIGYNSTDGLVITGQGSTSDVTITNDADATVISIPTGTITPLIADSVSLTTGTIILADGATVAQGTDKGTTVVISGYSGQITTHAASLAAGAEVTFTVTNDKVTILDVIVLSIMDSPDADSEVIAFVNDVASGSFDILLSNISAAADTGEIVINFMVFRGASS